MIGQTIGNAVAGQIASGGFGDAIGDAFGAVGDFFGFDGEFGYQGPQNAQFAQAATTAPGTVTDARQPSSEPSRELSLGNLGRALTRFLGGALNPLRHADELERNRQANAAIYAQTAERFGLDMSRPGDAAAAYAFLNSKWNWNTVMSGPLEFQNPARAGEGQFVVVMDAELDQPGIYTSALRARWLDGSFDLPPQRWRARGVPVKCNA